MPSHLLVESILLLLLPLKREYLCTTLLSKNVFKNFVLGILLLNFMFFHSLPWLRDNSQNSLGSVFDVTVLFVFFKIPRYLPFLCRDILPMQPKCEIFELEKTLHET